MDIAKILSGAAVGSTRALDAARTVSVSWTWVVPAPPPMTASGGGTNAAPSVPPPPNAACHGDKTVTSTAIAASCQRRPPCVRRVTANAHNSNRTWV